MNVLEGTFDTWFAQFSPQHCTPPEVLIPQEKLGPIVRDEKVPVGVLDDCPSLFLPQHSTVPLDVIPHVCHPSAASDVNVDDGVLET